MDVSGYLSPVGTVLNILLSKLFASTMTQDDAWEVTPELACVLPCE
jgi:hypothetical protein